HYRRDGGSGLVDAVDFTAGETAVARAGAAEGIAGGVRDGIVIEDIQANRAVAATSIDGHRVTAARAADAANRGATHSAGCQSKIADVHTRDGLVEGDGERDTRRAAGRAGRKINRQHRG